MAAEITGSGGSGASSGYVLDLTWSNDSSAVSGVTYSHDSTSGSAYDTVSGMIWECNQKETQGKQIYPDQGRPY